MNACCNGCSTPSVARPSMVVISAPSFMTASVRQELIRRPSTSTVQAPHWPWSQPFLVPVRSRWSRNASSKVVHGATLRLPLDAVDDERNRNFVRNLDRLVGGSFACQCHMHLRMSSAPRQPIWAAAMDIASRLLARLKRIERHLPTNVHFISPDAGRIEPRHRAIPIMPRMRATSVGDTSAVAATSRCSLSPDSGPNSECDWSISASNCGSRMVSS